MYNNVISDWVAYLELLYGTRSQQEGEILVERNWYEQADILAFIGTVFFDDSRLKLVDNYKRDDFIVFQENKPELVFNRPYPSRIDPLSEAWLTMMETWTGNTMPAE